MLTDELELTSAAALPFSMRPLDAKKRMSRFLAPLLLSEQPVFGTILWSFLSPTDQLVPQKFAAAYLPVWVLNANTEVNVTIGAKSVSLRARF